MVLMAVWLLPAMAGACPSDGEAGHAHGHVTAGPSHARGGHDHESHAAHDHAGTQAHHSGDSSSGHDEPECCAQSSQPPAAKLAVLEPNPRPTDSSAVLPEVQGLELAVVRSSAGAVFRRHRPPPLPYAKTRRPLLI